jgi:small neutral amino acid transporter SnatA (MarC family)
MIDSVFHLIGLVFVFIGMAMITDFGHAFLITGGIILVFSAIIAMFPSDHCVCTYKNIKKAVMEVAEELEEEDKT